MNCVIVEDLPVAAEYTRRCCEKKGNFDVKGIFATVPEALAFLDNNCVDLLFLDIEMPGEDGFKLLDKLPYKPNVIVTTSNIDHAYTGFEYRVNDFLKKPFTYQRFLQAAQKLNMDQPQKIAVTEPDHVFIKSEGKILKLNNEEIQYIESMGDYVKFITRGKKYITHHTVKALEEKLNKNVFLKIHRSFIVNLNSIEDLKENSVLVNGTEIPVSKKHRQEVLKRLPLL